jgi:DNA/RNA-binding domain of Phe-tRNA-synthetase-like protein
MKFRSSVSAIVFDCQPDYVRGVVVATGVNNQEKSPRVTDLLDQQINSVASGMKAPGEKYDELWMSCHRHFGSNPSQYPPAHMNLRKRVAKKGAIPFISNVVAIMNAFSLSTGLSIGGDHLGDGNIDVELRPATGNEFFTPLSRPDESQNPEPGEFIYVDSNSDVMCRRWNWQNSYVTRIRPETTIVAINIDALGEDAKRVCEQTAGLIGCEFGKLGANVEFGFIHRDSPSCEFELR